MDYRRVLSVVITTLVLAVVVAAGADDDHARAKAWTGSRCSSVEGLI